MPTSGLDYDKHGRPARVKPKSKDPDSRSIISGTSSRRHRDSSISSNRTALPSEYPPQRSQSTSSNVSIDQLPSLPESESGSPSSASSPLLRTNSKASSSSTMISSTFYRTPASLQPYLESESDPPNMAGDSQATPKAEKTKEQCEVKAEPPRVEVSRMTPPRALPSFLDSGSPTLTRQPSSESTKAIAARSSSQTLSSTTGDEEMQYKDIHQPAPKRPASSNLSLGGGSPNPPNVYPYGIAPPGQPPFYSPQLAYLPQPPMTDLAITQQALTTQGSFYYPEYVHPPPPAPDPPHQTHYAPGPENNLNDETPMALLSRVHYAMPDFHRLLESYQEMYGVIESRQLQIHNMQGQRAAERQQEETRFAKMEEEIEVLLKRHSAEIGRLKLDISKLNKNCKHLQDKLIEEQGANDRLEAAVQSLRADRKQMAKQHDEEQTTMSLNFSHDKDRMAAEHRTRQKALHDEFQVQIQKVEATLSQREAHLNRVHEEERHKLQNAWAKQKREIDDRHARSRHEMENKLETRQKMIDEERRTYLQAREGWDRERETMTRRWDEEGSILRKASEEQFKALTTRHEREKNDMLKQVSQTQHRTEKEEDLAKLQREIEDLRAAWEADRFKFQRTTAEFRSTARTLDEQNSKLQKLTEAFGDAVDLKGKGA